MQNNLKTTEQEHQELVLRLAKPGQEVLNTMIPENIDLWHGVTGVCTEAGELLDSIKKVVIYNKILDKDNVIEELGDIEFYLEQVRKNLGITRTQCLVANIDKLEKRFGKVYSDQAAQERADKICPDCNGDGLSFDDSDMGRIECKACNGTGKLL